MSEMILSKLTPPKTGSGFIERPRLIKILNQAVNSRVILLTAPAGYGKTVLVTQYLAKLSKPFVWYQLDLYDNDPLVFLNYLVTGIRQNYPGFAQKTLFQQRLREAAENPRLAFTLLVNSLANDVDNGLVIVFDDYHAIREQRIHLFLGELLFHLPDNIQIIITSRIVPPLNLSRLRVETPILSLDAAALRFNYDEIKDFLGQKGIRLTKEEFSCLSEKTGGWPAALRLMTESTYAEALTGANPKIEEVYSYLAAEVFELQTEEIRDFLLGTSVLEVMTPADCDRLLERNDSQQLFSFLEKQQLFLIPLSGKNKAYRYHQLFREFLIDRLGEKSKELRRRAGRMAREAGNLDQAVEYMILAGMDSETLSLLKEAGIKALRQGRWLTVARWLEKTTEAQILNEPWLCFFQAQVLTYRGRLDKAELLIINAEKGFNLSKETAGIIESQILRARILRCWGRYQQSLDLLDGAVAQLSPAELNTRFDIPLERSICQLFLGRLKEAETTLVKALSTAKKQTDPYLIAHLAEGLGNIYCIEGKYAKAMRLYHYGLEVSSKQHLPGYYMQDSVAQIYKDWGQLDQALEAAKRNVTVKENLGLTEALPFAYSQLGYVYLETGNIALASDYFRRGFEVALEGNGDRHFQILNHCFLGWCRFLQNRRIEGRVLAEEAFEEAKKQGGFIYPISEVVFGTILVDAGEIDKAEKLLKEAESLLSEIGAGILLCNAYKPLAWIYDNRGKIEMFHAYAEKYLKLAAKINYIRCFLPITYHLLRPILKFGLTNGVEVSFIQRILVQIGDSAVELLEELAANPDPTVKNRIIPPLMEIGGDRARKIIDTLTEKTGVLWASKPSAGQNHIKAISVEPLRIQTFGPFRVFFNNREITGANWRTTKSRDLFAYLVHQNQPVSIDQILEDLWPNYTPDKASANFHTTLYYLRQTFNRIFEKDIITYGAKRYQLRSELVAIDRFQFEEAVSLFAKKSIIDAAVDKLEDTLLLYKGDYLMDLDYLWIVSTQENLKNMYFEMKLQLAQYYLDQKEYMQAIAHLRQLIKLRPYSEEVLALLISALAKIGDYKGVKEQYQTFTKSIFKELGLMPSPELTALYELISHN